jgi:L-malate glycosyltransferase
MREDAQSHKALTVLQIASGDLWAGAETQLYYLATALMTFPGIKLHVVLLNDGVLNKRLTEKGVKVTVLDESKHNALTILLNLIKVIYQTNTDVIHTHRFKENILGSVASLFHRNSKCIRTIHGYPEKKIRKLNIRKLMLDAFDKLTEKYATNTSVFVSAELRDRLLKPEDEHHVIIENGVNFEEIKQNSELESSFNDENDIKRVVFIGRLVSVKRLDIFIDVAKLVNDNCATKIKFYIIGDGPLRSEVSKRIVKDKLDNIVCELGFLANPLPELKKMDCMVITSDHEGLPMSLLEAMYLKVLVISHNVGGISNVLKNNKSGILIDTQDPQNYAESIKKVLFDYSLYNNMVNQGYNNVIEKYSSIENAMKYIEIYKS